MQLFGDFENKRNSPKRCICSFADILLSEVPFGVLGIEVDPKVAVAIESNL
jgi:hypothetical protein